MRSSRHRIDLALLYLLLPVLIFWWAYVGGTAGAALGGAALLATWVALRAAPAPLPDDGRTPWSIWLGALLLAGAVLYLTGFPAGPFPWDWFKHWALIGLLADQGWPVHIELQGQDMGLRFYLAAYLVPAALAKSPVAWSPVAWSPVVGTAVWFGLGFTLVFRAVTRGLPVQTSIRGRLAAMGIFLLMAGADSLAQYGLRTLGGLPSLPWLGYHHEWWALDWLQQPFQYSSTLTALSWVPHQSIATFLVALMLCDDLGRPPWRGALGMGLLALWSPLGMIGLMPLLIWRMAHAFGHWWGDRAQRRAVLGLAALLVPLVLATARYLSSDLPPTGLSWPGGAVLRERLLADLPFCLVELGPCLLILGARRMREPVIAISLMTLLVLPCFGGDPPDFVMRASMGPLAILAWRASQVLTAPRPATSAPALSAPARPWRWALAGLVVASITSVNEAVYQRQGGAAHAAQLEGDPLHQPHLVTFARSSDISVATFFDTCGWHVLPQYFARHPAWITP